MKSAILSHFTLRDLGLDLRSGHTTYCCVSLINLYLNTKLCLKLKKYSVDRQTYERQQAYPLCSSICQQESPAIADKPARRESLPKIAPIRRAYNVVADNTGLSSFV